MKGVPVVDGTIAVDEAASDLRWGGKVMPDVALEGLVKTTVPYVNVVVFVNGEAAYMQQECRSIDSLAQSGWQALKLGGEGTSSSWHGEPAEAVMTLGYFIYKGKMQIGRVDLEHVEFAVAGA